jgi:hypothetical protein
MSWVDRVYHDHDGDDEAYWEARELDDSYSDLFDLNDAAWSAELEDHQYANGHPRLFASDPDEEALDEVPDSHLEILDQPGYEKALDIALTEAKSHGV